MTVSAEEFIRRFLMHVLPRGFVRIRNFQFLRPALIEIFRSAACCSRCRRSAGSARRPKVQPIEATECTRFATEPCWSPRD